MNRGASLATFAAVACVALFASANAPPDQYVVFGPQATSILDQKTHLLWDRVIDTQNELDHAGAAALCATGGKRLPTYRELLTLVDEDGHGEWDPAAADGGGASTIRYIDPNAFPGTPAGAFWTMSPAGKDHSKFKVVDFGTGESRDDTDGMAYVRCVTDD